MRKILVFILVSLILINLVYARVDEKALEKNVKQSLFKEFLEKFGITAKVSEEVNKTNPEVIEDLKEICEKTSGARFLIGILTLASILGWIYFYPAGVVLTIIEVLVILNYFCWFSI